MSVKLFALILTFPFLIILIGSVFTSAQVLCSSVLGGSIDDVASQSKPDVVIPSSYVP